MLGGVQWNFKIRNNTEKEIKYITMAWKCYNSVGDIIADKISGKNNMIIKYTGPLASNETTDLLENTTRFYNSSYTQAKFYQFEIEYMDGTKETLGSSDIFNYYGILSGDERMPVQEIVSDKFGNNIKWTLYDTGLLEITGTGAMQEISGIYGAPWYSYSDNIDKTTISEGITNIADYCFYGLTSLESVRTPSSVLSIGSSAFHGCVSLNSINLPDNLTDIGSYTFEDCTSLKNITIPSEAILSYNIFYGWTIKQTITLLGHSEAPDTWDLYWKDN